VLSDGSTSWDKSEGGGGEDTASEADEGGDGARTGRAGAPSAAVAGFGE